MAQKPASSSGPVQITDSVGKQLVIPLTALYFNDQGQIKADKWPLYTSQPALQAPIDKWLSYLVRQGLVAPGDVPPPLPAFTVEARDAGANGNAITIEIDNVTPDTATPGHSTADVTVTETDTYAGLTPSNLAATIGTLSAAGTRPGLVRLATSSPALPAAVEGDLAGSPPAFAAGTAFTLQSKVDDAEALTTHVVIKDVNTGQNSFTLVATWTKSVTGMQIDDLDSEFGYVVQLVGTVSAPPAEGTVTLVGGADPLSVAAAKAKGTVLAGS